MEYKLDFLFDQLQFYKKQNINSPIQISMLTVVYVRVRVCVSTRVTVYGMVKKMQIDLFLCCVAALDVKKQNDLSGFYRHFLNQTVGEEAIPDRSVNTSRIKDAL